MRWLAFALALTLFLPRMAAAEEVTEFTLDNGLQVVVIEDHRSPAVVHMMWYRAGAADEPPGVSGVAHLLEHLMFKGTENMEAGEFSRVVELNGGSDNAFTSWDMTAYFQRVAGDRLGLMMQMEADRMTNLQITPAEVATELEVVLEERRQRVDSSPGALYREQHRAAQYLNHPYGRPIIGWPQEVASLETEDTLAFYRTYYAPNNAILIVAGDADPDQVRRLAEEHYGPIPANPDLPERERVAEPPQLAERRLDFRDARIAQPYLTRSYLAPAREAGDQTTAAALDLLSEYLGGSAATSYLGRRLQFDSEVALYTGAFYDATSFDPGTFNLTVAPVPGVTLDEAEAALDAAIADLLENGLDAERLDRIKRQAEASLIYAKDNVQGLARLYGTALTSGLSVADVQAWPDAIAAVTAENVVAAAEAVLVTERSVTGHVNAPDAPRDGAALNEVSQ